MGSRSWQRCERNEPPEKRANVDSMTKLRKQRAKRCGGG